MSSIYCPLGLIQAMQDRLEDYAEMRRPHLEPSLGRMRSPVFLPTAFREAIARKLGVSVRTTERYDARLKEAS